MRVYVACGKGSLRYLQYLAPHQYSYDPLHGVLLFGHKIGPAGEHSEYHLYPLDTRHSRMYAALPPSILSSVPVFPLEIVPRHLTEKDYQERSYLSLLLARVTREEFYWHDQLPLAYVAHQAINNF